MFAITFADGSTIKIDSSTRIYAWISLDSKNGDDCYYLQNSFSGTINDAELSTSNRIIGIPGLIGSTDWIAFDDPNNVYKTSSVVNVKAID